jgi:hypothetical protein
MGHGSQPFSGSHPSRAELGSSRHSVPGCRIILQIRGLYPAEILYPIDILTVFQFGPNIAHSRGEAGLSSYRWSWAE